MVNESKVIWILSAVMFFLMTSFVMTMPLGPDYAQDMGFSLSKVAALATVYTASAAVSGLLSAKFLDRFDRRPVLAGLTVGLGVTTLAGSMAWDFDSLVIIRSAAGLFGGPVSAMVLTVLSDVVPPQRRGKAMGRVMSAFSVAAVIGVPSALKLSEIGGWRIPFILFGGLILMVSIWVFMGLPSLRGHLNTVSSKPLNFLQTIRQPVWVPGLANTALLITTVFLIVPNLTAWLLANTLTQRGDIALLFAVGGIFSMVTVNVSGYFVDRLGVTKVAFVGAGIFVGVISVTFLLDRLFIPAMAMYIFFMMGSGIRNVAHQTQIAAIPKPDQRAGFQSLNSVSQNLASAFGSGVSILILKETLDGRLLGMPILAGMAIALTLVFPFLTWIIQNKINEENEGVSLSRHHNA